MNYPSCVFKLNHSVVDSSNMSYIGSPKSKYDRVVFFTKEGNPRIRINGKQITINHNYILNETNKAKFDVMACTAKLGKNGSLILDEAESRRFVDILSEAKEKKHDQNSSEKNVESHHGKIAELSAKIIAAYSSYCHPIVIAKMTGEEELVSSFDDPMEKLCALCLKAGIIDELPQIMANFEKYMSKHGHTSIYNAQIQSIPAGDPDLLKEIKL